MVGSEDADQLSAASTRRPAYGLDAPGVLRNVALAGAACAVAALFVALTLRAGWASGLTLGLSAIALLFAAEAAYMLYGSYRGKLDEREALIDSLGLEGGEHVLDAGCGSGLLLVGAARRLSSGQAVGVDLWQDDGLPRGDPAAALENARREGVAGRVELETGDLRRMPFADGSFDVVVSLLALHGIRDRDGRREAVREIARVLRPGGRFLVADSERTAEYEAAFREAGCRSVRRSGLRFRQFPPTRVVSGVR